ncbi:MAG: tetratricopeptide repeat protein [Myxococcota bacterium]
MAGLSRSAGLFGLGLLLVATLAVYWSVLDQEFLSYDDQTYLLENPHVNRGLTLEGLRWALTATLIGNWHPVTWLSHMLDVQLFGLDAGAHKAVNLAIHLANGALLYALVVSLSGARAPALFVAGVLLLHPTHVESVAWIAERKDLLSTFFGLAAIAAWLGWARRRRRRAWWGSLGLYALSLASKSMWVTLPCLLLLLDLWPLGRVGGSGAGGGSRWRSLAAEKWPFFALSVGVSLTTLLAQSEGIAGRLPLGTRIGNAVLAVATYLRQSAWPSDLGPMYLYDPTLPVAGLVAASALLAALSAGALWQARRRPFLLVGWLWFLGMLVPVIGLVQVGLQAHADRYLYSPLIGLSIAVALGVPSFELRIPGRRLWIAGVAVAALAASALVAHTQVGYWHDQRTLFARALAVTDRNYFAHTAYGVGLLMVDRPSEAGEHFRQALEIRPGYTWARANLGYVLLTSGETRAALREFERAWRADPRLARLNLHMGLALERLGRPAEAAAHYRAELDRDPSNHAALRRLAVLLAIEPKIRDPAEAVQLARRACALQSAPSAVDLDVLAAAQAAAGDLPAARESATQALERARTQGDDDLIAAIEQRLARYRQGQALSGPSFAP